METYYKPYLSDESESESDSDDSGYVSEESLLDVPGRNPPIATGGPGGIKPPPPYAAAERATKFETEESKNTTLFMINSRDRDARLYPQPTMFTLRLPRLFRNVKQITITEISLLNSFFNFATSKGNTWMYVYENGRTLIDKDTGSTIKNVVKISIRDGTYNTDELVAELNNALNSTPLFADISLNDFINLFQSTGDYTILFNTPGPTVYNSLTQKYDKNQTVNNIVARYFLVVQTVGTASYSYDQCLVAYYYPVIKESIIASNGIPEFAVPPSSESNFNWYDYIVFSFQGLNDPLIQSIIALPGNQAYFDTFRAERTFNNFLVNKYVCTYNPLQGRLVINSPSLNDSIVNDLNSNYNYFLTEQVLASGLASNLASFSNLYNGAVNSNASLIEFYNFLQTRFATQFGVSFGLYTDKFYSDSNNELIVYNTNNRYGWELSLTQAVSQSSISSNLPAQQVPHLWSNLFINTNKITENGFVSTLNVPEFSTAGGVLTFSNAGESQFGYFDVPFDIIPTTYKRIEFGSQCRQNISMMTIPRYQSNRSAATEETYKFSMESTPLLYYSTGTGTNTKYYLLTDISGNSLFNMYTVYQNMFETPNYMRAEDKWLLYMSTQILSGERLQPDNVNYQKSPPATDIALTSFRPFIFFQVNADKYLIEPNARFYISFYVEKNISPSDPNFETQKYFPVPLAITWYKDRAGYMADVADDLNNNFAQENPRHFFKRQVFGTYDSTLGRTDISGARMDIEVNNDQITYFHVQLASTDNLPAAIPLRVYALLTNDYGTSTVIATQLDRLDMPYDANAINYYVSTMSSSVTDPNVTDPFNPASAQFKDPTQSIYNSSIFQLCYDTSNVSNNLMDYVIQAGNNNYYDPNNIEDYLNNVSVGTRYLFNQSTTGAASPPPTISSPQQWSLFFSSGQNIIRDTYNTSNNIYLSSGQAPRARASDNEFTLTNWMNPFNMFTTEEYLRPNPPVASSIYTSTFQFNNSSVFLTCSNSPLAAADSIGSSYLDETGVCGIGFFLPPSEIVRMDSFMLKFAYIQPSKDASNTNFTRFNTPLTYEGAFTDNLYENQTTYVNLTESDMNDWDDWYLYNRRNMKLGIFKTCDVYGVSTPLVSLSSAVCTMSLEKVTQVANYKYQTGTQRTREPDWGTYYSYKFDPASKGKWVVNNPNWNGVSTTYWMSTFVSGDTLTNQYSYIGNVISGTSTIVSTIVTDYFQTINTINNYSYLPRYFGISPSVQYDYASTNTTDINNSYVALPFYYDGGSWKVGSFYGLSFTRKPNLPSYPLLGAAPYAGPAGIYGFYNSSLTVQLYSTSFTSLEPYFWNTKITYNHLDQKYDPATDLSLFGGLSSVQTEYQDTMLFMYSNGVIPKKDIRDLSTVITNGVTSNTVWKWGMESNANYNAMDDQSGFNFLSYIYNKPVRKFDTAGSTIEYAIHVRGYDPIPKFTTGVRFIGKNYTDFGQVSLWEIAQEISSLGLYRPISEISSSAYLYPSQSNIFTSNIGLYQSTLSTNDAYRYNSSLGNYYSHEYADALMNFNVLFSTNVTFGKKVGFNGFTSTFTGYQQAIKTYVELYSTIRDVLAVYNNVLNSASSNLNNYVEQRYGNILPSSIINRNRITDPLPFQFLFSTMLTQPYKSMYDEWGMGYNLGFNKVDTAPPRTTVTSDTFIRIVQDFIYLRLNPELNLNVMSVSGKEDRAMCQDSTAQDDKYFAKILLNNFGGICRSAVVLPKEFNPVLGKYETISCQLVDRNGQQISNVDCEYNFVLNITEITNKTKDGSSLQGTTADLNVLTLR